MLVRSRAIRVVIPPPHAYHTPTPQGAAQGEQNQKRRAAVRVAAVRTAPRVNGLNRKQSHRLARRSRTVRAAAAAHGREAAARECRPA